MYTSCAVQDSSTAEYTIVQTLKPTHKTTATIILLREFLATAINMPMAVLNGS